MENRLKGLMAFRVVLVTLLLGGTLAIDVRTLSSLSDPRNVGLLGLIVLTYLLTIIYALSSEQLERLEGLAIFQLASDMVLTGGLVLLTGGLDSVFIFLFYVNIINTAIVAGRVPALWAAGSTALIQAALGLLTLAQLDHPLLDLSDGVRPMLPLSFEVGVNSAAAFLIALLAGHLSQRLGEISGELARKQIDLRKLRTLTQNILASLKSGLLTVDEEGQVIFLNQAATAITDIDAADIYGHPLGEAFPAFADALERRADSPHAIQSDTALELDLSRDLRFECCYEGGDGDPIYLGFSISELHNRDDEAFGHIIVFQDLTEVKKLEAKNKRAERMAAVGKLAASIAHEVRNPLASISGSVEMLHSVADLDDDDRALMNIILREVDRLDLLISEFLDYSRPSTMNFEPADLPGLVDDVLELFEKRKDTVHIDFQPPDAPLPSDWRVGIDREGIRQVLWNLLVNAEHALREHRVQDPTIRLRLEYCADEQRPYHLIVDDNGPGIPDAQRERIFEPFFTTREDGSGLGLATTHRLVREHSGSISVADSPELGGARFRVRLHKRPPLTHSLGEANSENVDEPADTAQPAVHANDANDADVPFADANP